MLLPVICVATISGYLLKDSNFLNDEYFIQLNCVFYEMGFSYMCEVQNMVVSNERTFINAVIGEHTNQRNVSDVVDLDVTNASTRYLPQNIFEIFQKLQVLTVYNSSLEFINKDTFYGAELLKQLYLDHNNIVEIPIDTFKSLKALRYLSLSYNKIVTLTSNHLIDLRNLFVFNMSNNKFNKLENSLLKYNTKLDWIFIDYGVLQLIEKKAKGYLEHVSWAIFDETFCIDYKKLTTKLDLTIDKIGAFKCEVLIDQ